MYFKINGGYINKSYSSTKFNKGVINDGIRIETKLIA